MSQRDILTDRCFNPTHQDESPICGVCVTRESRPEGTLQNVADNIERFYAFAIESPLDFLHPRDADTLWHRIPHTVSVGLKHRQSVGFVLRYAIESPLDFLHLRHFSIYCLICMIRLSHVIF